MVSHACGIKNTSAVSGYSSSLISCGFKDNSHIRAPKKGAKRLQCVYTNLQVQVALQWLAIKCMRDREEDRKEEFAWFACVQPSVELWVRFTILCHYLVSLIRRITITQKLLKTAALLGVIKPPMLAIRPKTHTEVVNGNPNPPQYLLALVLVTGDYHCAVLLTAFLQGLLPSRHL